MTIDMPQVINFSAADTLVMKTGLHNTIKLANLLPIVSKCNNSGGRYICDKDATNYRLSDITFRKYHIE